MQLEIEIEPNWKPVKIQNRENESGGNHWFLTIPKEIGDAMFENKLFPNPTQVKMTDCIFLVNGSEKERVILIKVNK